MLWTDSDMVWLDDPLPLLPDFHDPDAVSDVSYGFFESITSAKNHNVEWRENH